MSAPWKNTCTSEQRWGPQLSQKRGQRVYRTVVPWSDALFSLRKPYKERPGGDNSSVFHNGKVNQHVFIE